MKEKLNKVWEDLMADVDLYFGSDIEHYDIEKRPLLDAYSMACSTVSTFDSRGSHEGHLELNATDLQDDFYNFLKDEEKKEVKALYFDIIIPFSMENKEKIAHHILARLIESLEKYEMDVFLYTNDEYNFPAQAIPIGKRPQEILNLKIQELLTQKDLIHHYKKGNEHNTGIIRYN